MAKANAISNPFRTALNKDQLISTATVALTANQYVEVGRFTVPAGMALALGFEAASGQDSASGRFFADLRDNAAAPGGVINGTIRIDVHNAQDRVQATIFEGRTETLRTSEADRRQQLPFPFINAIATEDVSFVLKLRADAAGTLGKTNSKLVMDATSFEAK